MTAADDRHYNKMLDRMDQNRYYRGLGTAVYEAPEFPRPKRVRAPTGREHDTIRPCSGCGRSTRPSSATLEAYPNTVPRIADDQCSRCMADDDRGGRPARPKIITIDVELARTMYLDGQSATAIALVMGVSKSKVRGDLVRAGVTMRNATDARRAREMARVAA